MFKYFPSYISLPVFYFYSFFILLWRFLVGSVWGIFIVSIFMYLFAGSLFAADPLTLDELILWFVSQDRAIIIAFSTSIITIIGFLIAFATATANWKGQLLASLKVEVAGEIAQFFQECSKLASNLQMYSEDLIETINKLNGDNELGEILLRIDRNQEEAVKFYNNRKRLSDMSVEVHGFKGRHANMISSMPLSMSNLDSAINALSNIANKIWVPIPYIAPYKIGDPSILHTFVEQVEKINLQEYEELRDVIQNNLATLSFSAGAVRGILLNPVVDFNFWSLLNLIRTHKFNKDLINQVFPKSKKTENKI